MQKRSSPVTRILPFLALALIGALLFSGITYGSQVQNNLSTGMTMRAATHKHNIDENQILLTAGIGAAVFGFGTLVIGAVRYLATQNQSVIKSVPDSKTCPHCDAPIKQGWQKCPFCGSSLG